jgi:hypothetical protein
MSITPEALLSRRERKAQERSLHCSCREFRVGIHSGSFSPCKSTYLIHISIPISTCTSVFPPLAPYNILSVDLISQPLRQTWQSLHLDVHTAWGSVPSVALSGLHMLPSHSPSPARLLDDEILIKLRLPTLVTIHFCAQVLFTCCLRNGEWKSG